MTQKRLISTCCLLGFLAASACSNPIEKGQQDTSTELSTHPAGTDSTVYQSDNLIVKKIGENTFQHISYLQTNDFGKVDCNGMIAVAGKEAIVFDTPADQESSQELIDFLSKKMQLDIKAVVSTHFHDDCIAGLEEFHNNNIVSYANRATIDRIKKSGLENLPEKAIDHHIEIALGDTKVEARFVGEGHTPDNIVGYFPKDNILFGGCLIKEKGASKGNLEDANVGAWSASVGNIQKIYPRTQRVVPGHGAPGGTELLDYTVELFKQ